MISNGEGMKSLQDLCLEVFKGDPLHGLDNWRQPEGNQKNFVFTREPETMDEFVENLFKSLQLGWDLQKKYPGTTQFFSPLFKMEQAAVTRIRQAILGHFRKQQAFGSLVYYNLSKQ